ncbi:uncharacterized protein LOC111921089 [Lactuca sativa]|uniref:uncharacterized protein LOC111921089 n=1 Tax=Lactuca sativa TaxID=4236 RepID=UPI0022AFA043|nr:uncharacterized protein LOC111921089 [Lactuca sativa]
MGDIVTSISKLDSHGKLPSKTEKNPNVNVVNLRSRKQTRESSPKKKPRDEEEEIEVIPIEESIVKNDAQAGVLMKTTPLVTPIATQPPFPSRLATSKKNKEEKEILDTFRKVEENIPLLDVIKQIPRYANFLKELCTNKRKLKGNEKISMNKNAYTVLKRKLPPKCKDLGMFTFPCKIGNVTFSSAMPDLGASINVIPYSVYESLNVRYKSSVFPRGVLEDVLVQVNQLVFLADFYVTDLDEQVSSKSGIILLGRPFFKTARTKIDVYAGSLTMEFDGETISFNIYDAMRYPSDVSSLYFVDVVEPLTQELFELSNGDMLQMVLSKGFDYGKLAKKLKLYSLDPEVERLVNNLEIKKTTQFSVKQIELSQTHTRLPPALVQPPELELKVLPQHLKYAYLGNNETLLVIISTHLTECEEEQLPRCRRSIKKPWVGQLRISRG